MTKGKKKDHDDDDDDEVDDRFAAELAAEFSQDLWRSGDCKSLKLFVFQLV